MRGCRPAPRIQSAGNRIAPRRDEVPADPALVAGRNRRPGPGVHGPRGRQGGRGARRRGHRHGAGLPGQAAGLHDYLGLGRFRAQAARGRDNHAARLLDDGLPPAVGSGQRRADARAADARDDRHPRGDDPRPAAELPGRHRKLQRVALHRGARPLDRRRTAQDAGHRGGEIGRDTLQRPADQQLLHRRAGHARRPLRTGDQQHRAAGRGERRSDGEPPADQGAQGHRIQRPRSHQPPAETACQSPLDGDAARRCGLVAGVVERRALRHAHRCPGAVDGQPQNRQHRAKPLGRDRTAFGRGHPQRRSQRLQSRRTPFGRHFVRAARRYTHALQPLAHGRAEQPAQTLRGLPAQQLAHLGLRPPGLGSRRPAKLVPGGRHARGHRAGVGRFVPATAFGTHRTESQHRAVLHAGKTRSFAGMERHPCRALGQLPQPPACRGPGLRHRKRPEIYPAHRHTFAHRHLLPEIPVTFRSGVAHEVHTRSATWLSSTRS
mgnify:CR=1 FL=1